MRDPDATRKSILDAAEHIFLAKGFADASTAEIARKSGVTKSLIHHHFGSKEALWAQVKERRFAEYFDRQIAALREQKADLDLLRKSIEMYFHFLQRNPDLVRMLAWMALEGERAGTPGARPTRAGESGDGVERTEKAYLLNELGVAKIREGQAAGILRDDVDPLMILSIFGALTEHWFLHRDELKGCMALEFGGEKLDEDYLDAMLKVFFGGVSARPKT